MYTHIHCSARNIREVAASMVIAIAGATAETPKRRTVVHPENHVCCLHIRMGKIHVGRSDTDQTSIWGAEPTALNTEREMGAPAGRGRGICMYVCSMHRFGGTSTRAYTRTQAHGATPELRRVADTTSHGLSAGSRQAFHTDHHRLECHRRFIYKEHTSTHAEGTDPRGGLEQASVSHGVQ